MLSSAMLAPLIRLVEAYCGTGIANPRNDGAGSLLGIIMSMRKACYDTKPIY